MMRIAGLPAADQTRLRSYKLQMGLFTQPPRFSEGELALSIRFVTKLSRAVGAGGAEISMLALCFGKNSFIELPCRRP